MAHKSTFTKKTVKYQICVMVWGFFSDGGVETLVPISGLMDRFQFVDILSENLLLSAYKMDLGYDFILQQDNDPKHMSNYAKDFLSGAGIRVIEWPAQSPDLNPIENLWTQLKRQVRASDRRDEGRMLDIIMKEWEQLDMNYLQTLVRSIPKRLREVIANKGLHTHYYSIEH